MLLMQTAMTRCVQVLQAARIWFTILMQSVCVLVVQAARTSCTLISRAVRTCCTWLMPGDKNWCTWFIPEVGTRCNWLMHAVGAWCSQIMLTFRAWSIQIIQALGSCKCSSIQQRRKWILWIELILLMMLLGAGLRWWTFDSGKVPTKETCNQDITSTCKCMQYNHKYVHTYAS